MKLVFVYNPKSGSALSKNELAAKCKENNIIVEKFISVEGDISKKLASSIRSKKIIAAFGGDGTLSHIAGILAGSEVLFAPLPGGTLNHFTKDLGVPQDIDKALSRLPALTPKKIDLASVNNSVFINNSSVGLYPSSLQTRKKFESTLGKWPAAIVASVHTLFRFRTYIVTIKDETFKTPFVFVGNNEYALTGPGVIERKNVDKGELSIFIAKTASRRILFKIMLSALVGQIKDLDEFEIRKAESLTIQTTKKRLHISRDGEIDHVVSPLHFKIQKGALYVLAGE